MSGWLRCTVFFLLILSIGSLSGCGLWTAEPPPPDPEVSAAQSTAEVLAQQAEATRLKGDLVPYTVNIVVEGVPPETAAALEKIMRANSQLVSLEKEPPDSDLGLERRYLDDEASGLKVLRSEGYYEGTAICEVDWKTRPTVPVVLKLVPGRRFAIGKTAIVYTAPETVPKDGAKQLVEAPKTLAAFGVKSGEPAVAVTFADAVDKVPGWLTTRGFPFAEVRPVYRLYESNQTLDATVAAKTGPFARFGDVDLQGTESVDVAYLRRLAPWKTGDIWSSQRMEFYRDTLQQTGLFRDVRVEPAKDVGPDSLLPVHIVATDAKFRKFTGSMRVSTDQGFGVQGVWEHKNLFSAGERLKLSSTLTRDLQELSASFTKPAWGVAGQSLVLQAVGRNERTDAYDLKVLALEAGLDRYFDWRWWGGFRVTAQNGSERRDDGGWEKFHLIGLPVTLRYHGTNDPLNPTQGFRVESTVTPYFGLFRKKSFSVARLQGSLNVYHAPFTRPDGRDWDRLVLAGRVSVGAMPGTVGNDVDRIPAALRFYTGGGGSVRGYKYQSIGPKDKSGDPVGGLSFTEFNLEARFRVTESLGIVPFVDGGMVYDTWYPRPDLDIAWALGLGVRYFTPIGPIRLDVAFPLQNRGSSPFQVYFSIGQSF